MYDRCCSQFVVTREAVQAHPKSVYQTYLHLVLNATEHDRMEIWPRWRSRPDLHLSEEIWHHMFGVPNLSQVRGAWDGGGRR